MAEKKADRELLKVLVMAQHFCEDSSCGLVRDALSVAVSIAACHSEKDIALARTALESKAGMEGPPPAPPPPTSIPLGIRLINILFTDDTDSNKVDAMTHACSGSEALKTLAVPTGAP